MNEFSDCDAAAKSLRVGLSPLMAQMSDAHLTGRLTAIMKKLIWKINHKQEEYVQYLYQLKGSIWKDSILISNPKNLRFGIK